MRVAALVVLIVIVTFSMVRWFLLRPISRIAERLHWLRTGRAEKSPGTEFPDFGVFSPLAREVETMAEACAQRALPPKPRPVCAKLERICGLPRD